MTNQIKAALRSGTGKIRANNEDAFYFSGQFPSVENMNQETALQGVFSLRGSLFGVCDGIGGAYNGEVASSTAAARMEDLQEALKTKMFSEAIVPWTRDVNNTIVKDVPGGGCTIAMAFAKDQAMYIAHVGDSRVYRLHEGQLIGMTKDHSKVQMLLDAGIITPEQAAVHPQRHMVVRYIGMDEQENGICTATVARPMPFVNGDRYLLCTDGVTDMLDKQTLENLLKQELDTDACAQAIYQKALEAGGRDNITLIVLDVETADEKPPEQFTEKMQEDAFETTLGRKDTLPMPEKKADANGRVSVTHTYLMPHMAGKKVVIHSEIRITP